MSMSEAELERAVAKLRKLYAMPADPWALKAIRRIRAEIEAYTGLRLADGPDAAVIDDEPPF